MNQEVGTSQLEGPSAAARGDARGPGTLDMALFDVQMDEHLRRAMPLGVTVLISGETGTGKTRLARLIHDGSARRAEPFLVLDCGSLSPTLIESEMFGHVRG